MPNIVGGLRQRLVFDSIYNEIDRAIGALGWYDVGRQHKTVQFVNEPYDDGTEIPLNTLVLVAENKNRFPLELGSNYSEHRRIYYMDVYAENLAIGEHLAFDVEAILEGQMASISRGAPTIDAFDYTQATPPVFSVLEIEDVQTDRARKYSFPWEKHWWSIQFVVVDKYADEDL